MCFPVLSFSISDTKLKKLLQFDLSGQVNAKLKRQFVSFDAPPTILSLHIVLFYICF